MPAPSNEYGDDTEYRNSADRKKPQRRPACSAPDYQRTSP